MNKGNKNKLREAVASQSQLDPIDAIAADIDITITRDGPPGNKDAPKCRKSDNWDKASEPSQVKIKLKQKEIGIDYKDESILESLPNHLSRHKNASI